MNYSPWTIKDFEKMNWHDCAIYGFSLNEKYEFLLDIDYIFSWIEPDNENDNYRFEIAPCTLVFENVTDLSINLDINEPFKIEIENILCQNPRQPKNYEYIGCNTEYQWIIETQQGQISMYSIGFKLFIRQKTSIQERQMLGLEYRNGVSFEKNQYLVDNEKI